MRNQMSESLAAAGEHELRESLGQLEALCHREDGDAFLPLESEELTGSFPRRLIQFGQLVDDAVAQLVAEGIGDTSGLRAAAGNGWYGRYVKLAGAGCLLHVNARRWADTEMTPIWIRVKDRNWRVSPELRHAFEHAEADGQLRFHEDRHGLVVPMRIPLGVEREGVLEALLKGVREVASLLEHADLPPVESETPQLEPDDDGGVEPA